MNDLATNITRRFLIGQLARYGDCLYATTIARQIKHDHPGSHVTWAVASNFSSVLTLNPHVDSVWEIPISNGDYYKEGWDTFEADALRRKAAGDFDEIIFSQVAPLNWLHFTGTIRSTILSTYKKPITVPVSPVLILSDKEITRVKDFAKKHRLEQYKQVVLVECGQGSGQAKMNMKFAIELAMGIINKNENVCLILSSMDDKPASPHPQIIHAASLSFRENAEVTKYCSLLVGCSSGITWVATSEWAKKLPMLQLFSKKPSIFSGVHYDFAINGLDNSHIIEIEDNSVNHAIEVLHAMLNEDMAQTKIRYHQQNIPLYRDFKKIFQQLVREHRNFSSIMAFARSYEQKSIEYHAPLRLNYFLFGIQVRLFQWGRKLSALLKPVKDFYK